MAVEPPLPASRSRSTPVPVERRSQLAGKLARGEFPVVVEIVPPKGCDPTREVEGAQYLKSHGIDAVNIPDGSGSTARMSAQTLAVVIQQQTGLEALLHFSCRGRNVLSIQSDLLGAYALGLRNIWAVTGDPPQSATFPSATAVFDVDSIGLVNVLNNLNRGLDIGGNPLGAQTGFLIGVGLNPHALNPDEELRRFEYKIKGGANFGVIRPVFDVPHLAAFLRRVEKLDAPQIPLLAGIHPLTSYRSAEYLNNEVPGISVPPEILTRMRRVDTGRPGARRRAQDRPGNSSGDSRVSCRARKSWLRSPVTRWRWKLPRRWKGAQAIEKQAPVLQKGNPG